MQQTYSNSTTPSFAKRSAYLFDTNTSFNIYKELDALSEEIEKCRNAFLD